MPVNFARIKGVVLDMDGVIWRGNEILPGVPDFFTFLQHCNIPYAMATNNSTRQPGEYVTRMETIGIPVAESHVITSALVTAEWLTENYPQGTPVYVIGSEALMSMLIRYGFVLDSAGAKIVICGLDTALTYDKLRIAGQRILAGADFTGTNGDLTLPTADGISPGNGSILAALIAMTGRTPRLMGKPEPVMFHVSMERLGTIPETTLMIGDRLDTDIEGAQRAGLQTILVESGVHNHKDVDAITPDAIYPDLEAILNDWRQNLE